MSSQPLYKKLGCEDAATFWTVCPRCGKLQGKHASLQPLRAPEDGDASFCSNCGRWAIYENDALGRLRVPTAEEEAQLASMKIRVSIGSLALSMEGDGDQLDLLKQPPDPAPPKPRKNAAADRRQKSRELQEAGARRWIEAGKPIALEVARVHGFVTAELFRAAAEKLNALPPTYGEQRALSWIPSMFYQLVRDGQLQKRRRVDGSVVKEYSEEQGNDQVVYELAR